MDSERYVSIGDGNVYLVSHDPLDDFDVGLSDLILNDETPSFGTVTAIQFSGAENYEITYQEAGSSYRSDDVYFVSQNGVDQPLDPSLVSSYLKQITKLSLTDYVTYNVSEAELASYGLDDPQLTVTVAYDQDDQATEFVLHISRDPSETEDSSTITAYARVGDSQIVYQLTSSSYTALTAASYDDLRHQEVLPADLDDVSQIDITLDGASYTVLAVGTGDDRLYFYEDEELDADDLTAALEALTADSFTSESPSQKAEISLTLYLSLDGDPSVTIDLYRYDGSQCLAVVDGTPVSLVARSAVEKAIKVPKES
jgi:hypothetical protein